MAVWRDGVLTQKDKVVGYGIDCSNCQGVYKAKSREEVDYWKSRFVYCPFCGEEMEADSDEN